MEKRNRSSIRDHLSVISIVQTTTSIIKESLSQYQLAKRMLHYHQLIEVLEALVSKDSKRQLSQRI